MGRTERENELEKENLLLKEELERLSSPPYVIGTVLDMGKKTIKVSIDGSGTYEVTSDTKLKEKMKRGARK